MLERLQSGIFNKNAIDATRPSVTMEESVEIPDSNDKNDEENIGAKQWLIAKTPKV